MALTKMPIKSVNKGEAQIRQQTIKHKKKTGTTNRKRASLLKTKLINFSSRAQFI